MNTKYILEKIRLEGQLHDLLMKTNAENVVCTYNGEETTLAAVLTDIFQSVGDLPTAERVEAMVAAAAEAGDDIKNAMYQVPTFTQYRTKGNMDTGETAGDITGETLAALMGDELGEDLTFVLNGVTVGTYTGATVLSTILSDINGSDAGVQASYDQSAQEFIFTAKQPGVAGRTDMGEGLADALFGPPAPDGGVPKFSDAYGVKSWVDKITFACNGDEITLNNFNKNSSIEDIAQRLNTAISNKERVASYDRYTGQLVVRDKNGALVYFEAYVDDEDLGRVNFKFKSDYAPDVSYTGGKDAIFTAVKVNGELLKVSGKEVNIKVPTHVSQLENNSNFQTEAQVAAAVAAGVAGASHLKRKKVASLDAIDLTAADADQYIYMVPKTGGKNGDKYDEYMVMDGQLERVGDWKVDLDGYMEKEDGMGLSANDFTDALKSKLEALPETIAEATTGAAGLMSAGDKAKLDGMAPVTEAEKTAWDAKADTAEATESAAGLMSASDKAKLNGLRGVRYGTEVPADMQNGELFVRVINEA